MCASVTSSYFLRRSATAISKYGTRKYHIPFYVYHLVKDSFHLSLNKSFLCDINWDVIVCTLNSNEDVRFTQQPLNQVFDKLNKKPVIAAKEFNKGHLF